MSPANRLVWILGLAIFSSYHVSAQITLADFTVVNVHEDSQTEQDIATVACLDTLSLGERCPVCNIINMNPQNGPFRVWRKDGNNEFHVYFVGGSATNGLDYDRYSKTYFLTIQCTSANQVTQVAKVLEVDVQPNQPPVVTDFPGVSRTYDALFDIGTDWIVYDINVNDPESDPVTYVLYTEPKVDYFDIGQSDGIIKVVKDLRTAVAELVLVKVNISDGFSTVGPFTVTVRINNLNDRPRFTNLPTNVTLFENVAGGTLIYTLSYTDQFATAQTLEPVCRVFPANEDYKFRYFPGSRQLRLDTFANGENPLDAETTTYYNISCLLNDGFLDSVGGYINLYVRNVNEPPVFNDQVYYCVIEENYQNVGACDLSDIRVTDPENDAIIDYRLLSGNNSERFFYDNARKRLVFNVDYDVDQGAMPSSVMLTLAAVDAQSVTGSALIQVNIADRNDNAPEFTSGLNFYTVTQGQAVGEIGRVTARDIDLTPPNNIVTFNVAGGDASNYINVLSNGQVVYTSEFPANRAGTSQSVTIEAVDGGTPPQKTTGTVVVAFQTTTSTTTTTTTTTPPTTTPVPTTTTPKPGFFDYPANVVLFVLLMILAFFLLLGLLYLLLRYCSRGYCFRPSANGNNSLCPDFDRCDDCFRPSEPDRQQKVRRLDNPIRRQPTPRINNDYKDPFWKSGDHYEDGLNNF